MPTKANRIPYVPVQNRMYLEDAAQKTMTQPWQEFFRNAATDEDCATALFYLQNTTAATDVHQPVPVLQPGTLLEVVLVSKASPTADLQIALLCNQRAFARLTLPSGAAAFQLIQTTNFLVSDPALAAGDILTVDIEAGDGGSAGVLTLAARWVLTQKQYSSNG